MGNRKFTHVDPKDLKRKYPKAWLKLREWLVARAEDGGAALNEDMIDTLVYTHARFLPDFLDDQDIKIAIMPHTEDPKLWLYYNSKEKQSSSASNRNEAEERAIDGAFLTLEKELNQIK